MTDQSPSSRVDIDNLLRFGHWSEAIQGAETVADEVTISHEVRSGAPLQAAYARLCLASRDLRRAVRCFEGLGPAGAEAALASFDDQATLAGWKRHGAMGTSDVQETVEGGRSCSRATALNRAGRWGEAVEAATEALVHPLSSASDRCEALLSLAYAHLRLGQESEARPALDDFDERSASLPPDHWAHGYRRGFDRELGRSSAAR